MDKDELKKKLIVDEYRVRQEQGTEVPFSGKYWNHQEKGNYVCKVCGQVLFDSNRKIDSATGPMGLQGWPAFDDAISGTIEYREDNSFGMHRTEIVCAQCKAHLGHLFDDDHADTGKHFCVNSCAIDFDKKE